MADVTPVATGTGYVLATVTHGKYTLTARCRVDVTEKAANEEVLGVDLGLTKVTSELYSRNYASLDVLLRLKQNILGAADAGDAEKAESGPKQPEKNRQYQGGDTACHACPAPIRGAAADSGKAGGSARADGTKPAEFPGAVF